MKLMVLVGTDQVIGCRTHTRTQPFKQSVSSLLEWVKTFLLLHLIPLFHQMMILKSINFLFMFQVPQRFLCPPVWYHLARESRLRKISQWNKKCFWDSKRVCLFLKYFASATKLTLLIPDGGTTFLNFSHSMINLVTSTKILIRSP